MNLTPQDWHDRYTLQAGWTEELRRHLYARADLEGARRILEAGCGTGVILEDLISTAGWEGKGYEKRTIHGLDIELANLHLAREHAPTAALIQADGHNAPYASGTFDAAICHFLLLWVRNPTALVGEMARLVRHGGSVMALAEPDYGGRIDYPDELTAIGQIQERALRHQGADPRLGRRLASIFQHAGLSEIETGVLGGKWRAAPTKEQMESEWRVLTSDLEGLISSDEINHLIELDALAWKRGDRVLFVPTFYAWGKAGSSFR